MNASTTRLIRPLVMVLVVISALVVPAGAHPDHEQGHGSGGGVAPSSFNFDVLAHLDVDPDVNYGDLFFYDHGENVGPHVYVGTTLNFATGRSCGHGVKIVDTSRPSRPRVVATAGGLGPNVRYDDVVVRRIGGRDILAVGIQECVFKARSGFAIYDVIDPARPERLSFVRTPPAGVHELDVVVRPDGRALALICVPFTESIDRGGDFRIVDITDPEDPVRLADWGIIADSSLTQAGGDSEVGNVNAGVGAYAAYYAHSVRGADDGMTAYVSYWDGGVLKFDISDPAQPRVVGRTPVGLADEGDAHSMTTYVVDGTTYIFQNNEEISSLSPPVVTSSATGARRFPALENHFMPTSLHRSGEASASVHDAGDACQKSDLRGSRGKIALFDVFDPTVPPPPGEERCSLDGQVMRAVRSNAAGFLANFVGQGRPTYFRLFIGNGTRRKLRDEARGVPSAMFSDIDGGADAIRAELKDGEVSVTMSPQAPAWGHLQVFDETRATDQDADGVPEFEQVGSFSGLKHVVGQESDKGLGDFSGFFTIHNTETIGTRAYSSWYSHGLVALDITDPTSPTKVGKFTRRASEMWGVAVDPARGLVFGSDIQSGLWILRPTEGAAPPG